MRKAFIILVLATMAMIAAMAGTATPGAATPESAATASADSVAADTVASDTVAADSIAPKEKAKPRIREITPVDIDDQKPTVVLHYYDKHGEPLEEPVLFLATLDTITKPKSKPVYPLYSGVDLGLNFGDAILMAAGQSYGSFNVHASVSIHNWFFPVVEAGLGFANSKPKDSNFTYKTKPSFFAKIGLDYNFLYKSDPAYAFFVGLRAGFSSFKFDVDNVDISNGYWGENQQFNMRGLGATAFYGEALAGLKVKIYKNFSLGWSIRYHFKFKTSAKTVSKPWFIPGYGASSPIGISFSAIWTLPSPGRLAAEAAEAEAKALKKRK